MHESLSGNGRMAVVLDTGAVSRGSGAKGSNRERDIRRAFVDADLIEAVILLPENLFYNTSAPGIVMVVNCAKEHAGEILLINASKLFEKGRPKNYITESHVVQVGDIFRTWKEEDDLSRVVSLQEVIENDYNLSPRRYVSSTEGIEVLSLEDAVALLRETDEERASVDSELLRILDDLLDADRHTRRQTDP